MTTDVIESLHAKLDTLLSDPARHRWLSVEQAAQHANLSAESIRRLLSSGKLTAYRPIKGRVVVDRLQLDALIASSTNSPRTGRGIRR